MSNTKVNQSNTNTIISITAKAVKKKDKRESAKSSDSKWDDNIHHIKKQCTPHKKAI